MALAALLAALMAPVIPVHGTVLAVQGNGNAIVRNDAVPGVLPSETREYHILPKIKLSQGTGIDGTLDRRTQPWTWNNATIAGAFVPGLPDKGKTTAIDIGSPLPKYTLVDQNFRAIDLAGAYRGKVSIISFIFTRCADECPLISAKFAEMQRRLDPRHFRLIEITIDPSYDSPAILRSYGKRFDANPAMWSVLTGQPHQIAQLLNAFGISSLRVGDANFIHSDKVFLVGPDAKVAQIIQTTAFDPGAMVAQAQHLAGMSSNWFGRLELALIAGAAALCGGSQFAGIVLLETVLFLIIAGFSFLALSWIARTLWKSGPA